MRCGTYPCNRSAFMHDRVAEGHQEAFFGLHAQRRVRAVVAEQRLAAAVWLVEVDEDGEEGAPRAVDFPTVCDGSRASERGRGERSAGKKATNGRGKAGGRQSVSPKCRANASPGLYLSMNHTEGSGGMSKGDESEGGEG